jgi:hypothetical protein
MLKGTLLHVSACGHLQVEFFWIFRKNKYTPDNVLLICRGWVYKEWGFFWGVPGVSEFWGSSAIIVSSGSVCGWCSRANPFVFGFTWLYVGFLLGGRSWMWCCAVSVISHTWNHTAGKFGYSVGIGIWLCKSWANVVTVLGYALGGVTAEQVMLQSVDRNLGV